MTAVFGVCDPSPLAPGDAYVATPFVSRDMRKRIDPAAVLAGVRSVIVVAVGDAGKKFNHDKHENHTKEHEKNPAISCLTHAELSSLGTNADYHPIVRAHLTDLAEQLEKSHSAFNHKILVDSGTLDERAFAVRAGIGFIGRHGLVISPAFGTRFNIGLLLTTLPMDFARTVIPAPQTEAARSSPYPASAKNSAAHPGCAVGCYRCIQSCPTGALQENQPLNFARCLSYLTQKKELTAEEEILLAKGNQLYGCDICQNVCPHNAPWEKILINPQAWLHKTDADFKNEYGHTAMLWQGAELLRRNAKNICDFHNRKG